MLKVIPIKIGAQFTKTVYSVVEICSDGESAVLPAEYDMGGYTVQITYIGYKQYEKEDTRSEYEKWYDAYFYSYYMTESETETEVLVSPNVRRIILPHTVKHISKSAFKSLRDMVFEVDEKNEVYTVEDGKLVEIATGDIIWPYHE